MVLQQFMSSSVICTSCLHNSSCLYYKNIWREEGEKSVIAAQLHFSYLPAQLHFKLSETAKAA